MAEGPEYDPGSREKQSDEPGERSARMAERMRILYFRFGVLVLALVICAVAGALLESPSKDHVKAADCLSQLSQVWKGLYEEALKNESANLDGRTIADLIRAAAHNRRLAEIHSIWTPDEKGIVCPGDGEPYYVFSQPAVAVLMLRQDSEPVPILMCPPGAHGKVCVLYSDGSFERMTREEAEKLVSEQSPVPVRIFPEPQNEEK